MSAPMKRRSITSRGALWRRHDAIVDLAHRTQVLACDMVDGMAILAVASVVDDEHAITDGSNTSCYQFRRSPSIFNMLPLVKRQAEGEGLDRIFIDTGFEWHEPGSSMCLGMNEDRLFAGERCASTSNRNFKGR